FGRAALHDVLELVEDFALGTAFAGGSGDVVAAHVSHVVAQTRNAERAEIQTVAQLPAAFVFGVEVGPVGVRQVDGVAAITDATLILLIAAVGVAQVAVAGAALVRDGERVRAGGEGRCQAPDLVVVAGGATFADVGIVQLGAVAVEVQRQGLIFIDREYVVGVEVLLLQHVFNVGCVNG